MSSVYEIPLTPAAQTFAITLAANSYVLTFKWNTVNVSWVMDIADVNNNPIISGIPLITGANLLEQYDYLEIGGALYCQTDNSPLAVPTYENLGVNGHLYFEAP